jgi:DNA-binding LytR/AlgR family response regulator
MLLNVSLATFYVKSLIYSMKVIKRRMSIFYYFYSFKQNYPMVKKTCIIVDDDAYAIDGLKRYIESVPSLMVMKTYTDPVQAMLELPLQQKADLALLDIDMPRINGIELSIKLREKADKLVFTTSHTEYGYQAFEADADAYLLKPYSLQKFIATISKLFPQQASEPVVEYFFVKSKEEGHQLVKVNFKDVIAVESKQNYVMIHTSKKNILAYMSLTEVASILSRIPEFVKYHRSFIINRDHISSIAGNTLKMANGLNITVGDNFRKDFMAYLDERLLKAGRRV